MREIRQGLILMDVHFCVCVCVCVCAHMLSQVRLFATPWTVAYQAPPSMGFSRQDYWSGLPLPSPHSVYTTSRMNPAAAAKSLQSCPTLCYPVNCNPPDSSVHGILQARILKWVSISFSRGSSRPRDQTQVYHIAGRFFTV